MSGSDASMVERRERSADALLEVLAAAAAESPASESSPASSDGFGIEFGNNPSSGECSVSSSQALMKPSVP